jgi:hypothetical protein
MEIYEFIFWAYLTLATMTLIPTIKNILIGVKLNPSGASFDDCEHFNEKNRKRLEDHYSRLMGTLGFWKKELKVTLLFIIIA